MKASECTGCLGFTGPPCGCTCHLEDREPEPQRPSCLHPWSRRNVGRGTIECGVCGATLEDPFKGL